MQLYRTFVSSFEAHLSQLHVVVVVTTVSRQLYPSRPYVAAELDAALEFLQAFAGKPRGREGALEAPSALVLAMEAALLRVRKAEALQAGGAGEEAKALLLTVRKAVREGESTLAGLREGEDAAVPASVHRASAEYYKLVGPAAACHASTLLYLGSVQPEALLPSERHALALDIALASLVGEGIYNFGEVLEQPVLRELAGTPQAWLCELLGAFQRGDIGACDGCLAANRGAFEAQPTLRAAGAILQAKVRLLALVELVQARPTESRVLAFGDIARAAQCAVEEVEHLAMRAMSLGLVRGSINQVDQTVAVTFVMPRVLNKAQLVVLKEVRVCVLCCVRARKGRESQAQTFSLDTH
jgi:26S proteasome regulatory subunit N9